MFVGGGSRLVEVRDVAERAKLQNVAFLPFQPYEMLAEALSRGDVHFVSLRPGFEGLVVPSKAYGVLAAGRPIIYEGVRSGEIARMIQEENVGTVVEPGDAEQLERAVLRAKDDAFWREGAARAARELAVTRYSASRALNAYGSILTGETRDAGDSDPTAARPK